MLEQPTTEYDSIFFPNSVHKIYFKDSQNMQEVKDNAVQLVVTSPPYWNIKDYGHPKQIGYRDEIDEYFKKLGNVWSECIRVLSSGCRLCINIGDQYLRANITQNKPYQIIPLHAYLVNNIMQEHIDDVIYLGSIIWNKFLRPKRVEARVSWAHTVVPETDMLATTMNILPYSRKKIKKGETEPKPKPEVKQRASINLQKWRELFNGIWSFNGAGQVDYVAVFPDELPRRLMQMFTYEEDTVLDPFLGSEQYISSFRTWTEQHRLRDWI